VLWLLHTKRPKNATKECTKNNESVFLLKEREELEWIERQPHPGNANGLYESMMTLCDIQGAAFFHGCKFARLTSRMAQRFARQGCMLENDDKHPKNVCGWDLEDEIITNQSFLSERSYTAYVL
jgi:hypothetical protein